MGFEYSAEGTNGFHRVENVSLIVDPRLGLALGVTVPRAGRGEAIAWAVGRLDLAATPAGNHGTLIQVRLASAIGVRLVVKFVHSVEGSRLAVGQARRVTDIAGRRFTAMLIDASLGQPVMTRRARLSRGTADALAVELRRQARNAADYVPTTGRTDRAAVIVDAAAMAPTQCFVWEEALQAA